MIWTVMTTMMILMSMSVLYNKNPIKVSVLLMAMSFLMSMILYWSSNLTWFPMVLHLLFLGGILIMFLILSTISPNNKMMNVQLSMPCTMFFLICLLMESTSQYEKASSGSMLNQMQSFLQSSYGIIFCTMIISIYFVSFTILISLEKSSLRTTM